MQYLPDLLRWQSRGYVCGSPRRTAGRHGFWSRGDACREDCSPPCPLPGFILPTKNQRNPTTVEGTSGYTGNNNVDDHMHESYLVIKSREIRIVCGFSLILLLIDFFRSLFSADMATTLCSGKLPGERKGNRKAVMIRQLVFHYHIIFLANGSNGSFFVRTFRSKEKYSAHPFLWATSTVTG